MTSKLVCPTSSSSGVCAGRQGRAGRPRVGIHGGNAVPGGISRYVKALLAALDPEEFEVLLFCHLDGPYRPRPGVRMIDLGDGPAGAGPGGAQRAEVPAGRRLLRGGWRHLAPGFLRTWAGFWRESSRLARLFARYDLDLLHTNNTGAEAASFGGYLAGVPAVVGTFHIDTTVSKRSHWVPEYLTNHALHRAIAVSESTRAEWVRRTLLPASRVTTIPNGIDPAHAGRRQTAVAARAALGLPAAGPVVAAVGRLTPQKGFAHLLEAARLLADECPTLTLVIAGDGPLREPLSARAAGLGISARVRFLGHRSDVQPVYDAADVFALPSLYEAMPYALLEAMAVGLPVVASRVSGVPEVVVPGQTGILVLPADPQALAGALRPLFASPARREHLGRAGRERVLRHFNERETMGRTVDVYRDLLRGRKCEARDERLPADARPARQPILAS